MKPRFQDVRNELRFARFRPDEDLDLELFPDFLIVGPQRTGTTWLHENLIEHPQVFMPAAKELYYFNNLRTTDYHPTSLPPVSQELSWYLDFFRAEAEFVARRDAECRERFGEPYEIATRGEGTATYAVALARDPDLIRELCRLNPEIKVMTMVRNPIDRAWSHAKKDLAKLRGMKADDISEAEWLEFLEQRYQIDCGHHTFFAAKWREHIAPQNLFVGRFDDIVTDPARLLNDAFAFLGIRTGEKYVSEVARRRVNPTESAEMPSRIRSRLEEIYGDEITRLRDLGLLTR